MKWIRWTWGLAFLSAALLGAGYPLAITAYFLTSDTGLRSAVPSTFVSSLHRSISPRIPACADARIAAGPPYCHPWRVP